MSKLGQGAKVLLPQAFLVLYVHSQIRCRHTKLYEVDICDKRKPNKNIIKCCILIDPMCLLLTKPASQTDRKQLYTEKMSMCAQPFHENSNNRMIVKFQLSTLWWARKLLSLPSTGGCIDYRSLSQFKLSETHCAGRQWWALL